MQSQQWWNSLPVRQLSFWNSSLPGNWSRKNHPFPLTSNRTSSSTLRMFSLKDSEGEGLRSARFWLAASISNRTRSNRLSRVTGSIGGSLPAGSGQMQNKQTIHFKSHTGEWHFAPSIHNAHVECVKVVLVPRELVQLRFIDVSRKWARKGRIWK